MKDELSRVVYMLNTILSYLLDKKDNTLEFNKEAMTVDSRPDTFTQAEATNPTLWGNPYITINTNIPFPQSGTLDLLMLHEVSHLHGTTHSGIHTDANLIQIFAGDDLYEHGTLMTRLKSAAKRYCDCDESWVFRIFP